MLTHEERELLEWADERGLITCGHDDFEPYLELKSGDELRMEANWNDTTGGFFEEIRDMQDAEARRDEREQRNHERTHAKGVI